MCGYILIYSWRQRVIFNSPGFSAEGALFSASAVPLLRARQAINQVQIDDENGNGDDDDNNNNNIVNLLCIAFDVPIPSNNHNTTVPAATMYEWPALLSLSVRVSHAALVKNKYSEAELKKA